MLNGNNRGKSPRNGSSEWKDNRKRVDFAEIRRELHDLYPEHTPLYEEDRIMGFGAVDEELKRQGREAAKSKKITGVFWASLVAVSIVALLAGVMPETFNNISTGIKDGIAGGFGWYYLLLVAAVVIVCLVLIVSPMGAIRLGDPTDVPRFTTRSWVAMLFSAGMGIGLVFWGAAEPLSHFAVSAPEAPVGSYQALRDSFRYSFFHWGISAWAIYGIVALALGYFRFRKKEKSLISATMKPLFGSRMDGMAGKVVDCLTVFATIIGVGTSLGLGAQQINGGLNYLFAIPVEANVQLVIIAVATVLFILSSLSGLTRGIRILSNLNVILAILLVAVCLVIGPTADTLNALVSSLGAYLQGYVGMSLNVAPYDVAQNEWIKSWTIFYWAWWISWSPFVGVFIARISRGRTIREFLMCVILIPTVFSCIWFATFGSLSTGAQLAGADLANLSFESVLFATLQQYPIGDFLSCVALLLIASFFITSADSATFVLGMVCEDGNLNPRMRTKVVMGVLLSVLAATLLLAGGLGALQNVLIITALPFSVVLLLMTISICKELNHERLMMGMYIRPSALPDEDQPFRSYEDEEPVAPIENIQHDIETMQQISEVVANAEGRDE